MKEEVVPANLLLPDIRLYLFLFAFSAFLRLGIPKTYRPIPDEAVSGLFLTAET
jgi:hypothetical protein